MYIKETSSGFTLLRNMMIHLMFSEGVQLPSNICPWCKSLVETGNLGIYATYLRK